MRTLAFFVLLGLLPGCAELFDPGITVVDRDAVIREVDPEDWGGVGEVGKKVTEWSFPFQGDFLVLPPWPNPISTGDTLKMRFALRQNGNLEYVITRLNPGNVGTITSPEGENSSEETIQKLVSNMLAAGLHEVWWTLFDDAGKPVPPGTYRAKLTFEGKTITGDIKVE